jgi:hypothetical protein
MSCCSVGCGSERAQHALALQSSQRQLEELAGTVEREAVVRAEDREAAQQLAGMVSCFEAREEAQEARESVAGGPLHVDIHG